MTVMTTDCLSENSKTLPLKEEEEDSSSQLFEDIITDNPLIFRICCFCLMRSRQRVDVVKPDELTIKHDKAIESETNEEISENCE